MYLPLFCSLFLSCLCFRNRCHIVYYRLDCNNRRNKLDDPIDLAVKNLDLGFKLSNFLAVITRRRCWLRRKYAVLWTWTWWREIALRSVKTRLLVPLEAVVAVHRLCSVWTKWNLAIIAAIRTGRCEHFAFAAVIMPRTTETTTVSASAKSTASPTE